MPRFASYPGPRRRAQDSSRWAQDSPRWAQDSSKLAPPGENYFMIGQVVQSWKNAPCRWAPRWPNTAPKWRQDGRWKFEGESSRVEVRGSKFEGESSRVKVQGSKFEGGSSRVKVLHRYMPLFPFLLMGPTRANKFRNQSFAESAVFIAFAHGSSNSD